MKYPKVSVLIPTLNEERYISYSLDSIINQNYGGEIEILIAEGNSIDNTLKIIKRYQDKKIKDREIKLFNNPKQNTAIGRNICLFNSKGVYCLNFSGHMFLPEKDTIRNLVKEIEKLPGEVIAVGGKLIPPKRENFIQGISSTIFRSFLAGSKSVQQNSEFKRKKFVKGIAVGLYKTELLKREGGFNPEFWVNQDAELHYRLNKKGYKILYLPEIKIVQFKMENIRKLAKKMFRYGRAIMNRFYKYPSSLNPFQIIPAVFTVYILILLFSAIFLGKFSLLLLYIFIIYTIASMISTLTVKRKVSYILISPIFYLLIHTSYGIGTIMGMFKSKIKTSGR